ncbi:unnamed protein product [Litomosoides sigmodontis]|uniref:Uncharacterized protein n=1 Tax=Litomosoides sigmodontis TaxID=42156 RepID=A0A3P6T3W5_LITSI|nr:unnamed protein product [Litomosoides sigmodontis]
MFEEKEPGKPKNWSYTVTIITLIMFLNVAVIIVCRILLDSHDQNGQHWLDGKLRENLTLFLGMFAMSFCFYCCCCFCCGGSLCRWIINWNHKYLNPSKLLSSAIKTTKEAPIIHRGRKNSFFTFNVSSNDVSVMANVANDNKKRYAYANSAFINSPEYPSIRNNSKSMLMSTEEKFTACSKFKRECKRRNSF